MIGKQSTFLPLYNELLFCILYVLFNIFVFSNKLH